MSQLNLASEFLQERLPPAPLPMRVLDHLVEILTVIDEPLSLDAIFRYMIVRGYQPKGTSDSSKQYVLSVLKKYAVFSGSSWQLPEMYSEEERTLVESSSGQADR